MKFSTLVYLPDRLDGGAALHGAVAGAGSTPAAGPRVPVAEPGAGAYNEVAAKRHTALSGAS
jgi:hypothetical protein